MFKISILVCLKLVFNWYLVVSNTGHSDIAETKLGSKRTTLNPITWFDWGFNIHFLENRVTIKPRIQNGTLSFRSKTWAL